MSDVENLRTIGSRIESLLEQFDAAGDPQASASAEELVRLLTDLYGEALTRIVEMVGDPEAPQGEALVRALSGDALISSLMVLHDLHPDNAEVRVQRALEHISSSIPAGDVRLLEFDEEAGTARIRVLAPSGSATEAAELLVRRAMEVAAPDIDQIELDRPLPSTPVQLSTRSKVRESSR